jgi:glycosyltransferase involved in cell wall biosynthesis
MKIALVHDYIKEFGGAERVLMALHEMYPEAPIYTAFVTPGSTAARAFADAKVIPSWANFILKYGNLHSPLRFLIPLIWESFDFSGYDLVILSSSGYLTKPMGVLGHLRGVRVACYCHTPSRFLYGFETQAEWQRYLPVKIYGYLVAHFLRLYDWLGAQRVDQFIANSRNVAGRIKKFYGKDSVVVYPPVYLQETTPLEAGKGNYYLIVSRIVGMKGIDLAMKTAKRLGVPLKIAGEFAGLKFLSQDLEKLKADNIEFLGPVTEKEKFKLMVEAKAFLALAQDEDFGITPVEAMACGTPVIAFKGGGYLETVIDGKTGVFFEEYSVESLIEAIGKIQKIKFDKKVLQAHAQKFSKEEFVKKIKSLVGKTMIYL